MKYVDEFRDRELAEQIAARIESLITQPWTVMEICGGQTHSIVRYGIDQLLPSRVNLVHGPGCPVCVTPVAMIDHAIELAKQPETILASFGDMARVPGSSESLLSAKARGADLRLVYSPLDALTIARDNQDKQVVFFAVGFETTAPLAATAVYQAKRESLDNFTILISHVLVPPAMQAILSSNDNQVEGFLAAGHVCSVMGYREYYPIAAQYKVPIVVTGFEPVDILQGLEMCLTQLEAGEYRVENQYTRVVTESGNITAQQLMNQVFEIVPRQWRGVGEIAQSGFSLTPAYKDFDAQHRFTLALSAEEAVSNCISGQVLKGVAKPVQCPEFGKACKPEHPLGAPMVSSEGACAAYYRHRRELQISEKSLS